MEKTRIRYALSKTLKQFKLQDWWGDDEDGLCYCYHGFLCMHDGSFGKLLQVKALWNAYFLAVAGPH